MPNEIVMPRLGWTMETGTVVEWLKATGDQINAGDHIFAVESDKAITEVESLDSGVLYIPDTSPIGVDVPVGAALAFILAPGETPPAYSFGETIPEPQDLGTSIDDDIPAAPVAASNGRHGDVMPASPRARRVAAELGVDLSTVTGTGRSGRVREQDVRAAALPAPSPEPRATPSVRKLAEEIGVDLRTVPSNRPSGRVTRADLARGASATASIASPAGISTPIGLIRRRIRDRMSETARTVAPVTLTTEADATELWNFREQLKRDLSSALQTPDPEIRIPSITDLLVRISALALVDQPEMNVRLDGDAIVRYDAAHIGIAVDTDRGLLAPVLRDADRKSIHDIAAESSELIARTRDGSIASDQSSGSTFTVSNLGMFEIDAFTPIINLPEAAILGVGRIVPKPVVIDLATETIGIRRMLFLSLTFDHRVVDGAPAARFLQRIKQMIEHPLVALTR